MCAKTNQSILTPEQVVDMLRWIEIDGCDLPVSRRDEDIADLCHSHEVLRHSAEGRAAEDAATIARLQREFSASQAHVAETALEYRDALRRAEQAEAVLATLREAVREWQEADKAWTDAADVESAPALSGAFERVRRANAALRVLPLPPEEPR